jgi:hypothetical protein
MSYADAIKKEAQRIGFEVEEFMCVLVDEAVVKNATGGPDEVKNDLLIAVREEIATYG